LINPLDREIELTNYDKEDRVVSSIEYLEEVDKEGGSAISRVSSGIKKLDELINGFEGGQLITISGPTGQGKTTFAHALTKNFEKQNVYSLWFSFEVTGPQLFEKFAKAKLFYLPRRLKHKSMEWLHDRIDEARIKAREKWNVDLRCVFIDHLHYLVDLEKNRNMSIEVGTVIRDLKNLARDLNITIFLMAHTTKTKYDEMPTEGDIRDSSFVSQESDKVLMVWRERKKNKQTKDFDFTGKTRIIVSKERQTGQIGKWIALDFQDGGLVEEKTEYDRLIDEATS
jgi:replicative DNA helicase